MAAFEHYVDRVDSRIDARGTDRAVLLEREGRGLSAFKAKWARAMAQWDGKIAEYALRPPPGGGSGVNPVRVAPLESDAETAAKQAREAITAYFQPAFPRGLRDFGGPRC